MNIQNLPSCVIAHLFTFLDFDQMPSIQSVCKQWKRVFTEKTLPWLFKGVSDNEEIDSLKKGVLILLHIDADELTAPQTTRLYNTVLKYFYFIPLYENQADYKKPITLYANYRDDVHYSMEKSISLPKRINWFENLITLNLSNQALSDLPPLKGLKKLKYIDLSGNCFENFPKELVELNHQHGYLFDINMRNNKLESLLGANQLRPIHYNNSSPKVHLSKEDFDAETWINTQKTFSGSSVMIFVYDPVKGKEIKLSHFFPPPDPVKQPCMVTEREISKSCQIL